MDDHPSGTRKGPVDRTPPTGRLTVNTPFDLRFCPRSALSRARSPREVRGENAVEDRRGDVAVVTEPVEVGTADGLDRVPQVARNRGQRGTLGQQARGAEVPQGVEHEPVFGEPRTSERRLPSRVVELVPPKHLCAARTTEQD